VYICSIIIINSSLLWYWWLTQMYRLENLMWYSHYKLSFQGKSCPSMYKGMYYKGKCLCSIFSTIWTNNMYLTLIVLTLYVDSKTTSLSIRSISRNRYVVPFYFAMHYYYLVDMKIATHVAEKINVLFQNNLNSRDSEVSYVIWGWH
jgi:hypothetical protein